MKKTFFCKSNMFWILILLTIAVTVSNGVMQINAAEKDRKSEAKSKALVSVDDQNALCKKVSMLIKKDEIGKYAANSKSIPGRPQDSEYIDLDIDADGIVDNVEVSSGSEGSYLVVKLSSGAHYDLDESGFVEIVKFDKRVYALVTYWKWNRRPDGSGEGKVVDHRLYLLTKQNAKVMCDHF